MDVSANYYDMLGVALDASTEDVRRAWRRLQKLHHPDAGGSTEFSALLNEAYAVLSDARRRSDYDAGRDPQFEGFETSEAAFAAGGWPSDGDIIYAFNEAWTAYRQWLASGKDAQGSDYTKMREGLELLTSAVVEAFYASGAGVADMDAILTGIAMSFPAVVPTEAFARSMLFGFFESIPAPESISFPKEFDRCYEALTTGRDLVVPGHGVLSSEQVFAELSFVYFGYLATFFPDLTPAYVVTARQRYSYAARRDPFDRLLDALESEDLERALEMWAAWAEGYFSAGPVRSGYPIIRGVAQEVFEAAAAAGAVAVRETPRVATGALFAVVAVFLVLIIGVSALPGAVEGGCGGLFFFLVLLVVGLFVALGSGFKTGYKVAAGEYSAPSVEEYSDPQRVVDLEVPEVQATHQAASDSDTFFDLDDDPSPDSVHETGASPIGSALFLIIAVLVVALVYLLAFR